MPSAIGSSLHFRCRGEASEYQESGNGRLSSIPAPRAGGLVIGNDVTRRAPSAEIRSFGSAIAFLQRFKQDQFTAKLDARLGSANTLSGTFFFSNFPGFDPFPDPGSLASPVTLKRNDRNRTLAISDVHILNPKTTNEFRVGLFLSQQYAGPG